MKLLVSKIYKFLGSLKLAVFIIIGIAVITAVGTIVEARYDATAAAKLVYHTWWMYTVMILLIINLSVVMAHRWPWKPRHIGFLLAHIGIILLLIGGLITFIYGVDGSMRFGIGQKAQMVTIKETDFVIYSSFDGTNYRKVVDQPVDFFIHPPTEQKPVKVPLMEGELTLSDYMPYAIGSRKVVEAESDRAGAALRIQLSNPNVNMTDWVVQRNPEDQALLPLGPATIYLGSIPAEPSLKNEVYFSYDKNSSKISYAVFSKDNKYPPIKGTVEESGEFTTPWMGIKIKVLRALAKAKESYDYKKLDKPTPLTNSAVLVKFQNNQQWVQLNDIVKFFTPNGVYLVAYKMRDIDLGFPLELKSFEVDRYEGTMRASAYKSQVKKPDGEMVEISMNEPLKLNGFTFYQSSFEQDPTGKPTASVLSVNRDPGRALKYLGSIILSLGIVYMFWFKKRSQQKAKAQ